MTSPKLYCLVSNGVVVRGPEPLPSEWVSGEESILCFDKHPSPETYGWYLLARAVVPEGFFLSNPTYLVSLTDPIVIESGQAEPIPPPPPPPVPRSISPRQARLALNAAGLLDDVEAAIAAAPRAVQLAWEYSTEVLRDDPTLGSLSASLGLSSDQMDDLFRAAATL